VAFAVTLEATVSDDALDLLDILITEVFSVIFDSFSLTLAGRCLC
jgi:hypothetical protein